MQNKKGLMVATLVVIIVMMVVFFVLLNLILDVLVLLRATGEGGMCAWSAVFSSFGKKTTGIETFKINCPQRYVTIFMTKTEEAEVVKEKNKKENYFVIDNPIPSSLRKKLAEWYPGVNFEDKDVYREYRMNEVMAKEMKSCWSKLGRGELDLFSNWFRAIPLEYVDDENELNNMLRYFQFWDIKPAASQKACVICSRVRFSSQIKNQYMTEITSLGEWMRNHPVSVVSPKPLSYYEFLLDETIPSDFFAKSSDERRFYYTTDKDQAIVFMRVNIHAIVEGVSDILDIFPGFSEEDHQAIDAVFITPYDEVIDKCDAIVN